MTDTAPDLTKKKEIMTFYFFTRPSLEPIVKLANNAIGLNHLLFLMVFFLSLSPTHTASPQAPFNSQTL